MRVAKGKAALLGVLGVACTLVAACAPTTDPGASSLDASGGESGSGGSDGSGDSSLGSDGYGSPGDSGPRGDSGGSADATSEAGPATSGADSGGADSAGVEAGAAESGSDSGVATDGSGGPTQPLRIMPLGDSITGSTCWRALLWQMLNQNGYTGKFTFVGSRNSDAGCTPTNYNKNNEGHPGVLVTNFVNDADELVAGVQTPQSLFAENPADIVLFHFATNDLWNNVADATILAAHTEVIAALRSVNPNVTILAAQLIPMDPINTSTCSTCACPACAARVTAFNALVPAWASSNSTTASPIIVVDQWTGFDATAGADTVDGVHPNPASGCPKMATKWYDALVPLF
jgi:lysophospholipase L1-like esterase